MLLPSLRLDSEISWLAVLGQMVGGKFYANYVFYEYYANYVVYAYYAFYADYAFYAVSVGSMIAWSLLHPTLQACFVI